MAWIFLFGGHYTNLNNVWKVSFYDITPESLGIVTRVMKIGNIKALYIAGTHTKSWTVGTQYGITTIGGIYKPAYGWSKRIIYKTVSNTQYYALLEMDGDGNLRITPETVTSGGTMRIYELYI